jgi:MYXO-CTERM domain-containing protein
VCVGEPRDCDPTNSCQASGLCDPVSGVCAFTNKENGAKCGDDGECKGGVCDGANGTGSGAGGTGGGAASGGTGGDDGAAGEAGSGGDTSSGLGGTFSGPDFDRKPQGCDCRQAPGSLPRGATWLGWLGLLGFAARRRPRVTS